jgi:hypothetical protein
MRLGNTAGSYWWADGFYSGPIDYEKFDLENLSLQDAISGITDFESSDLIFQYPGTGTAYLKG